MTLHDAIAARMEANKTGAAVKPFEPDPALEEWGNKLDVLREHDPAEYDNPGLSHIRSQVATYRRRKANHEENR